MTAGESLATREGSDPGSPATAASCAACGANALGEHMRVRGGAGADGLIPTTKEFGTALGDIVRCRECGHMQLDRFPGPNELAAAYADAASDDYVLEEAGQRESFRRVLERIERFTDRGNLLDVGCWVGFLLAEARGRGWRECVGVEPSAFASDYARSRLGLDVRTEELFTATLPEGHFDAVVMGDVLEHLTRTSEALRRVHSLLRPDGVLCLELPDAGSRVARVLGPRWWSVIPTHVHYFTRHSARTMLARHGFSTLYVATDPKAFTVRYYLDKLGGYSRPLAAALVAGAERAGLAERMWTPDFRDRMILIARRAEGGG
jgi:SAM-dependent methyltransferase